MGKTRTAKRGIAIFLAALMTVSILPGSEIQAFAYEISQETLPVQEDSDNAADAEETAGKEDGSEETNQEDTNQEGAENEDGAAEDKEDVSKEEPADDGAENGDGAQEESADGNGDEEEAAEPETISENTLDGASALFGSENEIKSTSSDADFVISNGVLTGYNGTATELVIPEGVTAVGKNFLKDNKNVTSITFSSTVTSVGDYAFQNCTKLGTVTLNEGLETIGEGAFSKSAFGDADREIYGSLTIPGSVTKIGTNAFNECGCLKTVTFENGTAVKLEMPEGVFSTDGIFCKCPELKSVVLPDRLKVLPKNAFINCVKLEEVSFGSGSGARLESIGNNAFQKCALKRADLPASLRTIGDHAFSECNSLESATLNEGLETIGEGAFSKSAFGDADREIYGSLTIPGSVTKIGTNAFNECGCLKTVTFENGTAVKLEMPEGVFSTDGIFCKCPELKSVVLPDRLKALPKNAFSACPKLAVIYIPPKVTTFGNGVLSGSGIRTAAKKTTIYGESGSEAQNFAKKIGFPFSANLEGMGFSVTGISLNYSKITKAGETAIGQTVQLKAAVQPDTARDKTVSFSSSNENVATVNAVGLVTITGYGSAVITVTTKDGGYQASCKVSVLRQWTQEEKDQIKAALQVQNQGGWTVVTNRLTDISDLQIERPTGAAYTAEWKLAYDVETGTNDYYDIRIRQEGYQDAVLRGFTVTGVTLEGLSVSASNQSMKVEKGKEITLTAEAKISGLPDGGKAADLYKVEWRSANASTLSIVKEDQVSADRSAQAHVKGLKKCANIEVTATLVLLDQDGVPYTKDQKKKGKTWFEATVKITVLDQPVTDRIVITALDDQGQQVELSSLRGLLMREQDAVYQLQAAVYAGETQIQTPKLTWKSSNTALAAVTGKDAAVTLKIKKNQKGSAVISATSKDSGHVEKFRIVVKDSTPRLEETKVTFNLYKETLEETVHLLPSDGYQIKADSLSILNKDGTPSAFDVKKSENGTDSYCISVTEAGQRTLKARKSYNLLLSVKTSVEEQEPHQIPLTVQVVKTAPKLTIRQEAIDLYRKDAQGTVRLSSAEEIERIQYTSLTGAASARLVQKTADAEQGIFTFGLENAGTANYNKPGVKGRLVVKFKGYKDEASYNKEITLSANKKLPTVKAVAEHGVLYPNTALDTTVVRFYDKAGTPLPSSISVEKDGNAPRKTEVTAVRTAEGNYEARVRALNGAAGKLTVKWEIQDESWYAPVKVSCVIQTQKKTALSFENSTLNLNTDYGLERYEPASTRMILKGYEDREIISVTVSGADKKSVGAQKALVFGREENRLTVGIQDAAFFRAAGTYQYQVRARLEDSLTVEGKIKVAVKKTAASASLKAKGSIDLLNRAGTEIVYTPVLKNYTDKVVSADLYGERAGSFRCTYNGEDGKIHLQAKEGALLKQKTAYKLKVRLTLASGVELVAPVTVKLQQKAPKLQKSAETVTLFESVNKAACERDIAITVKDNVNGVAIDSVKLVNDFDTFTYEHTEDGAGKIWVSDIPSGKVNKKYTLKFAVTFQDGASNAAPTYVTVKVDYRK